MFTKPYIFIFSFLLLLVAGIHTEAQFVVMRSGVSADLHCVEFPTTETGYAAGLQGVLVKTTDGGRHWTEMETGTTETINNLFFTSGDKGFLVGENSFFAVTTNGGESWTAIADLPVADYTDIHFVDSLAGFAIGHGLDGGVFCRTTDGGNSWQTKMINQDCSGHGLTPGIDCDDIYLTEMSFLDHNNGLVAGFTYNFTYGKHPFICKTDDGGKTFKDISPVKNKDAWYDGKEVVSINYMNNHDACAVMNTGNGTDFMFISDYRVKSFEKINLPSNFSSQGRFFTSQFLGRFIGYFAGIIEGESQIIKTTDQGDSFMFLNPPTNNTLYASYFTDQNNGYFVGEKGTIIYLSDKANIVYSAASRQGEYDDDPPYSVASLKRKNKVMQVHIYNLKRNNPKNFSLSVQDSQGNTIPIKPKSVKIYSDEIRIRVKVDALTPTTYFYSVQYSDRAIINGKLNMSSFAQLNH